MFLSDICVCLQQNRKLDNAKIVLFNILPLLNVYTKQRQPVQQWMHW